MAAAEKAVEQAAPGNEIALSNPENPTRFDPQDLRSIQSFEDAQRLIAEALGGETLADATYEIGDGFTMLDDKNALLNVPFVAVQWAFTPGDYGAEYVIMRVLTERGDKYVIVDGGTGICDQMREYTRRTKRNAGLLVKRGLRKSEYDNEFGHGVTFYLNV